MNLEYRETHDNFVLCSNLSIAITMIKTTLIAYTNSKIEESKEN